MGQKGKGREWKGRERKGKERKKTFVPSGRKDREEEKKKNRNIVSILMGRGTSCYLSFSTLGRRKGMKG